MASSKPRNCLVLKSAKRIQPGSNMFRMDQATKPEKCAEVSCLTRVRSTVNDRNGSSVSDSATVIDLTPMEFETVEHERGIG